MSLSRTDRGPRKEEQNGGSVRMERRTEKNGYLILGS